MSAQVIYETDHHSLFCDSFNNINCSKFLFFIDILLKSKRKGHIRRNINSKEKKYLYVKSVLLLSLF